MSKPIKISVTGVYYPLDIVTNLANTMSERTEYLVGSLMDVGRKVADGYYRTAQYDGTNDVAVTAYYKNKGKYHKQGDIVARGNAVSFIEYGSGVHYVLAHPWANEQGMVRGKFGYGLGNFDTWRYKGNPGTNGEIITEGKHVGEVLTHGNPPARAMWFTDKAIRNNVHRMAKEVFRKRW